MPYADADVEDTVEDTQTVKTNPKKNKKVSFVAARMVVAAYTIVTDQDMVAVDSCTTLAC